MIATSSSDCTCFLLEPSIRPDDINFPALFRKIQSEPSILKEIKRPSDWEDIGLEDFFFRCSLCKQKWRFVYPDGPFRGAWGRID